MINTSAAYKEAIKKNRILHHEAKIEFSDGTALTPQDQDLYTFKISENTSNEKSFDLGSAIAKQLDLKINNIDGEYSKHKFSGAKITARVGLEISGKTEWLKKGVFYADPGKTAGDTISVTAVDGMTKFDVSYSKSGLSYPATLGNIVRDACSVCGITMSPEIASFEKSDFVVTNRPVDSSLTFRNILQFVGEIACLNFKMNADDQLTASWYDTNLLESETAEAAIKVEHYSGTIETDDVVITGVKVTEESVSDSDTEEKNEIVYIYGSTGYVLEIKENKLIQEGNGASVAEYVGRKVNGIAFRPVSIHTQGDPSIEAGDIAVITDRKGNKSKTILTGVIYTAKAQQDLICGAESPAEQSAVRYSKATQVYRELRKTVAKQKTEFEKSLEALKTAMGEKRGLYPITEVLEDGSSILYFCDQDTVAESKIVVKLNASGWGMSTDGGKTWNTGVLVDGTMIAKILNTIGINADWINTGAIEIKTEDGETIFRVDMDSKSVYMSGDVRIGGKKFSESIDNAITDSKNYADSKLADYSKTVADSLEGLQGQIDGQIESFYYEYEPSLQNIPASEWTTTEERKKHEGDLFFWKPNKDTGEGGYAYRFLYDSSVSKWEWVLVQDTDITKALAAAQNAQDTADGKRRTFVVTPYPPYDIGDTWNQEDGDILTCVVARAAGTSYVSTDWKKLNKYTDDTTAEEAKKAAEQAKEAANIAESNAKTDTANKLKSYSTTSEMNSAIQLAEDNITSTVSKTYVTTSTYETGISDVKKDSTTKANNALKDAKADTESKLKSYSTTEEMKSAIKQSAESITSTVSKTYVTTTTYETGISDAKADTDKKLKNYSTTEEMNSAIKQAADKITSTVKVVKVGSRNLILNSKADKKAGFFQNFDKVANGYGEITLKSKKTYARVNIASGFLYTCRDYTVGEEVTWSYDIMYTAWNFPSGADRQELWIGQRYTAAPSGETATGIWTSVTKHDLPVVGVDGCKLNTWYHVTKTLTIPAQASANVAEGAYIQFYNSSSSAEASFTARIKNVKLEKGNVATDWTPAPEDVDKSISAVSDKFADYSTTTEMKSAIKQSADAISSTVSKKVGTDEIISKINQSAESVSIKASKINFNGLVTANSYFKILKDGSFACVKGTIGGFTIKNGSIFADGTELSAFSNGFKINGGLKIYCGSDTFSDSTDTFQIFNLSHVTSGGHVVFASDGSTICYLSSSSKRYKDHISDMSLGEAEKILDIPVVWFRYKEGYLDPNDQMAGKNIPGLYAEDVYNNFPEAAYSNADGKIENWNERMIIPAMLKLIQELYSERRKME